MNGNVKLQKVLDVIYIEKQNSILAVKGIPEPCAFSITDNDYESIRIQNINSYWDRIKGR